MRFVRICLETSATHPYYPIEVQAIIDDQNRIVGNFPQLGIWGKSSRGEYAPFELRGTVADFGSIMDEVTACERYADFDLADHPVVLGKTITFRERGDEAVEYRITRVSSLVPDAEE